MVNASYQKKTLAQLKRDADEGLYAEMYEYRGQPVDNYGRRKVIARSKDFQMVKPDGTSSYLSNGGSKYLEYEDDHLYVLDHGLERELTEREQQVLSVIEGIPYKDAYEFAESHGMEYLVSGERRVRKYVVGQNDDGTLVYGDYYIREPDMVGKPYIKYKLYRSPNKRTKSTIFGRFHR